MYANDSNVETSLYGPFGFDAAWLVALALKSSLFKLSDPQLFNFQDLTMNNASEIFKESLLNTRFTGVTVSICMKTEIRKDV